MSDRVRGENEQVLGQIAAETESCRKCPLWQYARHAVPGEGPADARLLVVGEAPGEREDLTGRPFVGRAGAMLSKILTSAGLARSEVFIANIVKHRPPENRDPTPEEVAICTQYLDRQIAVMRPEVILAMGRHSSRYLLGKVPSGFEKITEVRGRIFTAELDGGLVKIVPTFHPAAALYNPSYRTALEEDMRTAMLELSLARRSFNEPG
jgi:DNA polymerase